MKALTVFIISILLCLSLFSVAINAVHSSGISPTVVDTIWEKTSNISIDRSPCQSLVPTDSFWTWTNNVWDGEATYNPPGLDFPIIIPDYVPGYWTYIDYPVPWDPDYVLGYEIPDYVPGMSYPRYTVKKWNMSLINNFAEVIYEIWGRQDDNIDALFVPEYSTLEDTKESLKQSAEGKKGEWLGLLDTETTLLLCHGAMICGVSECYKWKEKKDSIPIGFVGMLGLIHGYRGKGLGELLMRIILKGFADEGMKYARVNPTVENVPAFNLYKKLGFMEIEERSKVYYWRR